MAFSYEEFDLSGVRTYPLSSRRSKARAEDFATPSEPGGSFKAWFDKLPAILAGEDIRRVVRAIVDARARQAGIIWGIGAHVIKTGVSPVLIDLMRRGFVSALAMNGAGVIHDFEIALAGATSEDVDEALGPGRFGMAVGEYLSRVRPPHADRSLAAVAWELGIPLTAHVAVGTDIIHMHPTASG